METFGGTTLVPSSVKTCQEQHHTKDKNHHEIHKIVRKLIKMPYTSRNTLNYKNYEYEHFEKINKYY